MVVAELPPSPILLFSDAATLLARASEATGEDADSLILEAVGKWKTAAAQGYDHAQYSLGLAYEQGLLGLAQDHTQAVSLYKAAASQVVHISIKACFCHSYTPGERGSQVQPRCVL